MGQHQRRVREMLHHHRMQEMFHATSAARESPDAKLHAAEEKRHTAEEAQKAAETETEAVKQEMQRRAAAHDQEIAELRRRESEEREQMQATMDELRRTIAQQAPHQSFSFPMDMVMEAPSFRIDAPASFSDMVLEAPSFRIDTPAASDADGQESEVASVDIEDYYAEEREQYLPTQTEEHPQSENGESEWEKASLSQDEGWEKADEVSDGVASQSSQRTA